MSNTKKYHKLRATSHELRGYEVFEIQGSGGEMESCLYTALGITS